MYRLRGCAFLGWMPVLWSCYRLFLQLVVVWLAGDGCIVLMHAEVSWLALVVTCVWYGWHEFTGGFALVLSCYCVWFRFGRIAVTLFCLRAMVCRLYFYLWVFWRGFIDYLGVGVLVMGLEMYLLLAVVALLFLICDAVFGGVGVRFACFGFGSW